MASHVARFVSATALLSVTVSAQAPVQFEVASIKRNTGGQLPVGPPPQRAGQTVLRSVPASVLIGRGYPGTLEGLPAWADSERYDVIVKADPDATRDQLQQMWRQLLAERMKPQAHSEPRPQPAPPDAPPSIFVALPEQFGLKLEPTTIDGQALVIGHIEHPAEN